ncbi:NUDIX hydrolase [Reyranella sp.]|uniref:NUDIX hydrolase n=1 Tax=Reyranella sp. TaxID=1929291 RepID=UPI003BA9482B
MADPDGKRPWRVLNTAYPVADRWLRLRTDLVQTAGGRRLSLPPVIEHPDWVDVVALTPDDTVVLVSQYRHAVGEVRIEFPAGTVEAGEPPLSAIRRELLEETGYASDDWHLLGSAPVCPAVQDNRIFSYLALGARRVADQTLDAGEAIRAFEMPLDQFLAGVEAGGIELPALQLAGLWWLRARLGGRSGRGPSP